MPKKLEEIFGSDIDNLDSGVILKGVLDNIKDLDEKEFSRALEHLTPDGRLLAMKERCKKAGDKVACMSYDIAINGDKGAPAGSPKHLGLRGLWEYERNRFAKETLEKLGEL